jgi:hypothetical protein
VTIGDLLASAKSKNQKKKKNKGNTQSQGILFQKILSNSNLEGYVFENKYQKIERCHVRVIMLNGL